jgi:hypothetical protein
LKRTSCTFNLKKAKISKTKNLATSQIGCILHGDSLIVINITAHVSMAVNRSDMSITDFTSLSYLQSANKVSKARSVSQT